MDYLYASRVNERIVQGSFPQCALQKDSLGVAETFDFFEIGRDILVRLRKNPESLYTAISTAIAVCKAGEHLLQANNFESPINLIVNTAYNPAVLNTDSSACQQAITLCPVVTEIDKSLWLLISTYGALINTASPNEKEDILGTFFAWTYLLRVVQDNEYIFGRTLDFSSINNADPIFDIIMSPWGERDTLARFVNLTPDEKNAIEKLECTRKEIKKKIAQEISYAETVAEETEREWDIFLRVINNYSEKESNAVRQICMPLSKKEKLDAVGEYISVLRDNSEGYYRANGEAIRLTPVFEAVEKRMHYAAAYCVVCDRSGSSFRLHQYAVNLLKVPITFNLLLLYYHRFRLEPQKDKAIEFCNLALHSLKCNLFTASGEFYDSVDATVAEFYQKFLDFCNSNQGALYDLAFDDVQQDTVFIGNASLNMVATAALQNLVCEKLDHSFSNAQNFGMYAASQTQQPYCTKEQLDRQFAENQEYSLKKKEQIVARQAVVSLNIAYLFCDALRIMQNFNKGHFYFEDETLVAKWKSDLEWEIDRISCSVYTRKANIKTFREEKGIDARTLSEREAKEEELRSVSFVESVIDVLDEVEASIDNLDIEGLINLKAKVRDEIRKCAICTLTDQFSERFISIGERICNRLVGLCKTTEIDFDNQKQKLLHNLGCESRLLPLSSLDSLTTAELLYRHYASDTYAKKGFDYSSISALYYQAFEDAYNKLIWRDYAKKLNNLTIDGQSFTRILHDHRRKTLESTEAAGYLPIKSDDRMHYVNKNHTSVNPNCTYGAFGTLLVKHVVEKSEMFMFCKYLAELTGFTNSEAMLKDAEFIRKVHSLGNDITKASRRRNEASHGGNLTTISQCKDDKVTVLDELINVREDSLGLIQKLLYLMRNSK